MKKIVSSMLDANPVMILSSSLQKNLCGLLSDVREGECDFKISGAISIPSGHDLDENRTDGTRSSHPCRVMNVEESG